MMTDNRWAIHHFESVGSTQDMAKQYLAEGRPLPFAILADSQTSGRGRIGNLWTSPKGNLYVSLVIGDLCCPVKDAGRYSFLTAVALMETLSAFGVVGAQNKWPNDVLVGGKKIAGILLESDIGHDGFIKSLIIGAGVNLQSAPDGAVSVAELTGKAISPDDFLERFVQQIQAHLDILDVQGFSSIRAKWLGKAYGLGTEIRVRLPHETFYGQFQGLDDHGALMVLVAGEERPRIIHSGDVFFERKSVDL